MTVRRPLPARTWLLWRLVLLLLLGGVAALALGRRTVPPPLDYLPASVEPTDPLTLTNLRAV